MTERACSQSREKDIQADQVECMQWVLLKHRIEQALDSAGDRRLDISACLPEAGVLVERCRYHYALLISRRGYQSYEYSLDLDLGMNL